MRTPQGASQCLARDCRSPFPDQGIASLRVDKRGVGASGGDYWETGSLRPCHDPPPRLISSGRSRRSGRTSSSYWVTAKLADRHAPGPPPATRWPGVNPAGRAGPKMANRSLLMAGHQVLKACARPNKWLIDLFHIDTRKAQQKAAR